MLDQNNANKPQQGKTAAIDLSQLRQVPVEAPDPCGMPKDHFDKLDFSLQARHAAGQLPAQVACVARVDAALSDRDREALTGAGASIGAEIGDIITLRFAAERLKDVAALPFVKRLEGR